MSEFWIGLTLIYIIGTLVAGCLIATQWWLAHPDGNMQLLWLPNYIVAEWCETHEINKVGHCIADIIMNILLGPATILAMLIVGLCLTPVFIIILFTCVFRKR